MFLRNKPGITSEALALLKAGLRGKTVPDIDCCLINTNIDDLSSLDFNQMPSVDELFLIGNKTQDWKTLNLHPASNLKTIILAQNPATNIDQLDLTKSLKLRSLQISHSPITNINGLDLSQNVELTDLVIWGNQIADISQEWLDYLPPNLRRLSVAENNLNPAASERLLKFAEARNIELTLEMADYKSPFPPGYEKTPDLIGLHIGECICDIIEGRVRKEDVRVIYLGEHYYKNIYDPEAKEKLEASYSKNFWRTNPELGKEIFNEFLRDKKNKTTGNRW